MAATAQNPSNLTKNNFLTQFPQSHLHQLDASYKAQLESERAAAAEQIEKLSKQIKDLKSGSNVNEKLMQEANQSQAEMERLLKLMQLSQEEMNNKDKQIQQLRE